MNHSFDIEIAKEYGVNIAIMLSNLDFWILKNKANNKHFYDGKYWTYNSIKAFHELFPYWSEKQIRSILEKMLNYELIEKGNYSNSQYNRTCWYSITDLGNSILRNSKFDLPKKANRFDQKGETITDINTYINTDINNNCQVDEDTKNKVTEIIKYLNDKTNKNFRLEAKSNREHIVARLEEGYTIRDFKYVIDIKTKEWINTEMDTYLCPQTLFRPSNFEKYLNQKQSNIKKAEERKGIDEDIPTV